MPRRASASSALPAIVAASTATAPANSTTPTGTAGGQAATIAGPTSRSSSGGGGGGGPSHKSKTLPAASQAGPSASAPPSAASASGSNTGGATHAAAARPRRIMPSRSRRGGPGVGISDVDTHILETLRRRRENDPLIPAHARLLLTTDSTRVRKFGDDAAEGSSEGSQSNLNTSAYERYFDKPEVIHAYREQQLIQTPEFTLLSEGEAVGGRFRPRSLEDEGIDTSDAAYEKRHRKYEAFEKRQRLREKEKLKHEHYKLKERIEQLRALEPSSFLSAPESFFTTSRRQQSHLGELDAQGGTDAPEPSHNEGEWRKHQMLDVANSLDARYRTLLDTAPSRAPDLPTPTPPPQLPPPAAAPTPTTPQTPAPTSTPNVVARRSPPPTNTLVLRHPQRTPLSPQTDVIELDSDGDEKTPEFVKVESVVSAPAPAIIAHRDSTDSLKLRIRFPNRRLPTSTSPRVNQRAPSPSSSKAVAALAVSSPPKLSASPSPTRPRPKPIFKNPAAPPGPYARVPFAKRLTSQDVADSPSPLSSTPSSLHASAAAAAPSPSTSTTLPTLRRRPSRAVAHGKSGSLVGTITLPVLRPPHVHVDGSSRPHKRPRVELYDEEEEEESPGLDTDDDDDDDDEVVRENAEEEEEEEEVDDEGVAGEEGGRGQRGRERERERESRRERWRECALYREAQRHAGAPSGRKTHRQLGIFGLKGFPAEVEHLRDFVPPRWALPREDPRVVQQAEELERERERVRGAGRRDGVAARGAESVRGGATGGGGGGGGGGAMGRGEGGGGGDGAGVWQRRLRDPVAVPDVTEDGEDSSCRRSDPMVLIETASTVDSQATEVMI